MNDGELQGRPVAVLGAGIEGRDLARFLSARGARVTVFDTRQAPAIAGAVIELDALGAETRLGPIDAAAADGFDALYVSQSVLLQREPFVLRMQALGRPVSSMLREFLRRWPGPVCGITGSSGKTTTTSLVASAFSAAGRPHILGGNIGAGLLAQLDAGTPESWAVLEISHTQLQLLEHGPEVAAITNVTPNHLDQFRWEEYVALKRQLVQNQPANACAILNASDTVSLTFRNEIAGRCVWFNAPMAADDCFYLDGETLIARRGGRDTAFLGRAEVPLRGAHNVENVLCAAATATACGIPLETVAAAVRRFQPVAHRLEVAGSAGGVTYVNDSIATSPERTLAGMRSFDGPLILLLGGRDKNLPLQELVREANARARAVILFGEAARLLANAFAEHSDEGPRTAVVRVTTLAEAVAAAQRRALPGDVVLLSPACTSFDAYPNFERRGEEFRRLAGALAGQTVQKDGAPSPR
ncbi:MAG TPA: UDP-N-acetylmuramoyl-L-alanine--D-glutamate ligase [Dehalococcoidia bacterium]|nr:UDP-N-acetylmuramoyl-L-alanine--D-glutamate ligase [Dehalococcoidia bacterium]